MFSQIVRDYTRKFFEGVARILGATGISPNIITITGTLLMIVVAIVIAQGYLVWGGILLTIFVLFDAVDGALARTMGQSSRFGAFLDSTLDRYAEAIIFLGLLIYYMQLNQQLEQILIYLTVVGSLMVSYSRARAEGIGVPLKDGWFTRFERIFLLVVGLLFYWTFSYWLTIILLALAIFTNLTAFQRMYLVWVITSTEEGS